MNREYPEHPSIGVGALIVDGDRIVLVRRGSEPLKGQWSIPGGVLETGEMLATAVKREVLEETGLVVEVREVAGVVDRIIPDAEGKTRFHYVLVDYLCLAVGGEIVAGSDVDDARWVTMHELESYQIAEFTRQMIDKVMRKTL